MREFEKCFSKVGLRQRVGVFGGSRSYSHLAVTLCALIYFCLTTQGIASFTLVPISMDFEPSGRNANRSFRVENQGDKPIAVQISMVQRKMDLDGKESYPDAESDFVVYPTQTVLEPKQSQKINVRWIGIPNPEKELAYRIIAEQLPVNLDRAKDPGAKIAVLMRYLGTVYITPKNAKPDVVVESVEREETAEGNANLVVTLHNRGGAHTLLEDLTLKLSGTESGSGNAVTLNLAAEQLKGMAGENMLAGQKRRFVLPWPEKLKSGNLNATITYTESR